MGGSKSKSIKPAPSDISDTGSTQPVCDPCLGQDKLAKAWCAECNIYLCFSCMQTHAKIHKLVTGKNLPQTRPKPKFLTNDVIIKQVVPVATLQDTDLGEDESVPRHEKIFKGCVCIDEHYVTIGNKHMRLYDKNFTCVGELDFMKYSPNSICHLGRKVVVSFDRLKNETEKDKKRGPKFADIEIYSLNAPSCFNPDHHLEKQRGLTMEGECFSTGVCPVKDKKTLLIAVGVEMDDEDVEHDIKYKIQIIKTNGQVIQNVEFNPRGEPNFEGRFFICGSMKFGELCITELKHRRVRGIDIRTGKSIYEFDGGFPQGVTVDSDDNIYVYNDYALYWIPTYRNKIYYMLQNFHKKSGRKDTDMKCAISFDNATRHLYVTNSDKDIIEVYRIT